MNNPSMTGLDRLGLDDAFAAEEVRKSNLILEGQMLEAQQQMDEAARKFAQAAEQEERLANRCASLSLHTKAALHFYSAASCWARAGNFYRAILLSDELLSRPGVPETLHRQIQNYVHTLRGRRAQWTTGLTVAPATAEV
jgi:hypothetical protein